MIQLIPPCFTANLTSYLTSIREGLIPMKLLAIDGNSIMNRAYYGIKPLSNKEGICTNALTGFMNIYLRVQGEIDADHAAVAFDLKAPTFRHKKSAEYKANRHGMPDDLAAQMPFIKDILRAMGISVLECEGFEADDILGTLSALGQGGDMVYILTGDRDSLQLVNDNVTVLLHTTKELIHVTPEKFGEMYGGLEPLQLIQLKALQGDTSDNISGVKGIGEKTALDLIQRFHSIDGLYAALDAGEKIGTPGLVKKLTDGREDAYLSEYLATIVKDVPVEKDINAYAVGEGDPEQLSALLTRLEMYKLMEKLNVKASAATAVSTPSPSAAAKREYTVCEPFVPDSAFAFIYEGGRLFAAVSDSTGRGRCFETADEGLILDILTSPAPKYTFACKQAYRFCFARGKRLENVVSDGEISGYLLDPSRKEYKIGELCGSFGAAYDTQSPYPDVCALEGLCSTLDAQMDEQGMGALYRDIELPLTEVLASMEHYGVCVDAEGIKQFGEELKGEIAATEQRIYFAAGHEFNIASPKQLGTVLFEELGLPSGKKTKTGYSTNADVLEGLRSRHPIIEDIMIYRQYTKLMSTYVEGLLKQIEEDGRIHTVFRQTETRTGRISSTEPNLQNIPVRTELGRRMRRFFTAPEGSLLVDADYSQIELRILASMSGDENMQRAFLSGQDIHATTASQVFGMPIELVTPEMRRAAKAVNFGIVYGIGAYSLSQDIDTTVDQAQRYIESYLSNFSGVDRFLKECVSEAQKRGYSLTMAGRRRYIPELAASNKNLQAFGRRVAMNAPVQGTAADVIKTAMVKVYKRLQKELPGARLILQIHDELIIECSEAEAAAAAKILSEEMPRAAELPVPLIADVKTGRSWFETH